MILQRYLFREISRTFLAVFVMLLLIAVSIRFVQYLSEAAAGKIGVDLILTMLALKLVAGLVLLLPPTLYLAVYLALDRLDRDNETTAMMGLGLGTGFFLKSVLKLAVGFALGTALLSFYLAPLAEGRFREIEAQAEVESDITGISAGRFKEFREGDGVVYVEGMSENRTSMSNVFVQIREAGRLGVLTSGSARFEIDEKTGDRYVVSNVGHRYEGTPGQPDYAITDYETYGFRLDRGNGTAHRYSGSAASTESLWQADDRAAAAELQWRASAPLLAVLLALLAVVLVRTSSRRGRYVGLFTATLIYFTYSNMLAIARTLTRRGDLPVPIGLWWVHALVLLVILVLFLYPSLKRWPKRHRRPSPPREGSR